MPQPNAPIGIFDSGLGGLTVLQAIQERLPNEALLYFGDTAHLPYGDKSPQQVRVYVRAITRHLLQQGVKAIVVACNTASAAALGEVQALAGDIPVIEVISPAVRAAISCTRSGIVGVIGTKTTVGSGTYTTRLSEARPGVRVLAKATPLLVPLIEENWLDTDVLRQVIATYLCAEDFADMDTLILGCTHYPIITEQMRTHLADTFAQPVMLITAGPPTAASLADALAARQLLAPAGSPTLVRTRFQVSDLTPTFQQLAQTILGRAVTLVQCNPHLEG